jgi:hypothetical protein
MIKETIILRPGVFRKGDQMEKLFLFIKLIQRPSIFGISLFLLAALSFQNAWATGDYCAPQTGVNFSCTGSGINSQNLANQACGGANSAKWTTNTTPAGENIFTCTSGQFPQSITSTQKNAPPYVISQTQTALQTLGQPQQPPAPNQNPLATNPTSPTGSLPSPTGVVLGGDANANTQFAPQYGAPGACGGYVQLPCAPAQPAIPQKTTANAGTGTPCDISSLTQPCIPGQSTAVAPSGGTAGTGANPVDPAANQTQLGQAAAASNIAQQTQNLANQSDNALAQAQNKETAACSGAGAGTDACVLAGQQETIVEKENGAIHSANSSAIAASDSNSDPNSAAAQTSLNSATTAFNNTAQALNQTPAQLAAATGGGAAVTPGGGAAAPGGAGGAAPATTQDQINNAVAANAAANKNNAPDETFTPSDKCLNTQAFGISNNCSTTKTLITTTQVMVMGGQIAGSTTLSTMGQSAQQNVIANGASQSSLYQSSIDMAKDAAKAQLALGATQLAMGYVIHSKGKTAGTNATNLEALKYGVAQGCVAGSANCAVTANQGSGVSNLGAENGYNTLTNSGGGMNTNGSTTTLTSTANLSAATANGLANNANKRRTAAYTEQNNLQEAASTSALTNMVTGGQALLSGAFAWRNADAEQNLLNKLNGLPVAAAPSADPFNTLSSAGSPTTITGDGITGSGSGASAAASPGPMASGPLGNALGNAPDNSIAAAPITPDPNAAPDTSNDIPSGGDMGGGAIGTSSAPAGSDADPQAKYADNGKGVAGYESAGMAPGGGGAKNGGSGSDSAINPKDLLAAMMDQMNGKKDEPTGQDILAYGRSPASDAPFAPLPKSEDVFGYIHKAYQGLQRKSRVGLN